MTPPADPSSPAGAPIDRLVAEAEDLVQRGRPQEAYARYQQALAADPAHAAANHGLGLLMHQGARRHAEGAQYIARAVEAAPRNAIYRSNLGVVLKEAGETQRAVESYEAALQIDPSLYQTRSNLGVALLALGRTDAAIAAQRATIAAQPDFPEAHANLGLALLETGVPDQALTALDRAIGLKPDYANAQQYRARALLALNRPDEAELAARQALRLRPQSAPAHHMLASVLVAEGRLREAVDSFRAALALAPEAGAYRGLGTTLSRLGDFPEAIMAFRAALTLDDADAASHAGVARALGETGGVTRALDSARRAVELDPDNLGYRSLFAAALLAVGRLDAAFDEYGKLLVSAPESLGALSAMVFASNYRDNAPAEETVRRARELGALLQAKYPARQHFDNDRALNRRLRVGLVSGDLSNHPVAFFLESMLRAIDRDAIELFAYALSPKVDETTERLRAILPHWRAAAAMSPEALNASIRADRIDILIDLTGHTRAGLPPVFALKPAPIEASWLGYSGTTGLPAMDYVLADAVVAPQAEARLFSETVWRLPDSYLCYTPAPEAPPVSPLPALANGFITFGSFNNLNKLSDRTIALWAKLLMAMPTARLALKGAALRRMQAPAEFKARFAAAGADPSRVDFLAYEQEMHGHLGTYRTIDIGLDPFPYNGTTTTCEALLMGVPVLTLKGDRFIAHVGESLLQSAGLAGWIAADPDDFIAKATAFAADLPGLAALRAGLRDRLIASPLCDAPRFARNFEAAMRQMWWRWCAQTHH